MKVKVLIPFTDKHTGAQHKKDDILEISAKRFNEIIGKGKFVEAVDESKNDSKK